MTEKERDAENNRRFASGDVQRLTPYNAHGLPGFVCGFNGDCMSDSLEGCCGTHFYAEEARRIAACWNRFVGIPTDAIEAGCIGLSHGDLRERLKCHFDFVGRYQ